MDFIEILNELMIDNDLSQVKLAKMVGVRQGQVSEWLNGKSKPGYDSLKALALALNVSADVLLGIKDI